MIDHLDLSKTAITDAGLDHLDGLATLQTLALHGTEVSPERIATFKGVHPKIKVFHGGDPDDDGGITLAP